MKRRVWDEGWLPRVGGPGWSIHPPEQLPVGATLGEWLSTIAAAGVPLELMPAGILGCGADVELAMDVGVPLAVDVSHVQIQLATGRMEGATWARIRRYDRIEEIHVSRADGAHDAHLPLTADTFGLDWARERVDRPRIVECWMHRLDDRQRAAQLAMLRA